MVLGGLLCETGRFAINPLALCWSLPTVRVVVRLDEPRVSLDLCKSKFLKEPSTGSGFPPLDRPIGRCRGAQATSRV